MKRRDFLKALPALSAPLVLNGIPMHALGADHMLARLAAAGNNDRVLILIQLHGGNDGLNTLIPIDQYGKYFSMRPNIAISSSGSRKYITLDSTLPDLSQAGLHPDMTDMKSLYDQGKLHIAQGVAYENLNQSHFRSRDIWLSGSDYNNYLGSGWAGRYLDYEYPDYPASYPNSSMPDPLALEIGNSVSLAFHRDSGIPASIALNNPSQFYNLAEEFYLPVNLTAINPPSHLHGTPYHDELNYIIQMQEKSDDYASRLKDVYDAGANSMNVTYPEKYPFSAPNSFKNNELAPQLKMIARLLSGGIKTRIFLTRITRFDTHAEQVTSYDPSMGGHAALLYHISSAMKAFQEDLKGLSLEDRVMSVTFSEFGRRPASNASYGTDHGTAAPMFIFGKCVNPGVSGTNPSLDNLDSHGNIKIQHDYRQVFTGILKDWMGASDDALSESNTRFHEYIPNRLDLVSCSAISGIPAKNPAELRINECFPNPATSTTTISFTIAKRAEVRISIVNQEGMVLKEVFRGEKSQGNYIIQENISMLPAGIYLVRIEAASYTSSKKLVIAR